MLSRVMAHISSLRGPKIARSKSLERRFDFLQFLQKQRHLHLHVFYLKYGLQYPDRKEYKTEKETFLIQQGVKRREYKRKKEGGDQLGKQKKTERDPTIHQKEEKRRHKRRVKNREKQGVENQSTLVNTQLFYCHSLLLCDVIVSGLFLFNLTMEQTFILGFLM